MEWFIDVDAIFNNVLDGSLEDFHSILPPTNPSLQLQNNDID